MDSLPRSINFVIVSTIDSNLVSLIASEYLTAVLDGHLYQELYDSKLLPIASSSPTYGIYVFKNIPELALILRRSQIRYGQRKNYFRSLTANAKVKFVGIGSLPVYLKPESVLSKGKDTGLVDRFGLESFVVYCENGNVQESARHLTLNFLKYLNTLGFKKELVNDAIERLPRLKEIESNK
eukprot:NODE_157_length_16664_cov_0.301781.p9 type:complete len:181 gc:universal NODE_157_length_16664_cov_0.301781:1553-1011(-)